MAKPVKARPVTAPSVQTPVIVAGVGVAADSLDNPALSARVAAAMSQAVTDTLASGVSIDDSATIKAAMMMARASVLRDAGQPGE